MTIKSKINISKENIISKIDDRLYGSFIEHMGRAIYTGIYEPEHPLSAADGFRQDVIDLIKPLNIPIIRYPGGNFVSGYRWEDGVGPKETRPVRPELAWLAMEPNRVGTNEFMDYLKLINADPMLAVNLGTRGPQDAANLLEYCNFRSGTYYSDLRIKHGYPEPHNVKLWCLGNEMDGPWQICAKTADEYGRAACEAAKMMKWLDPEIELVVCGSSFREMPTFGEWEETVLRHTYEYADYLSLHTYYGNTEGDIQAFLASNISMDGFIKEVAAICDKIKKEKKSDKDIKLSFDEWNIWYHFKKDCKEPEKWIQARPIEEEIYDFADALLLGSMMITLINNSDVVKIACLAQLINTIAPIMTEPGGKAWIQTIYYPFLYTSVYGRGTALDISLDCPSYSCSKGDSIPYVDCAAVFSEDGNELTLFMVNKNLNEDIECSINLNNLYCHDILDWIALEGYYLEIINTKSDTAIIPKHKKNALINYDKITFKLSSASWNMIRLNVR